MIGGETWELWTRTIGSVEVRSCGGVGTNVKELEEARDQVSLKWKEKHAMVERDASTCRRI